MIQNLKVDIGNLQISIHWLKCNNQFVLNDWIIKIHLQIVAWTILYTMHIEYINNNTI